jgi:Flp pilus assembly protein TadD
VGVAAFFIVARLAASRVPLALTALATVFVVAAFPLARTRVPFLSRQLTAAGFGAEGVCEGAIQPPGGGETPAAASSPLGEGMRRFQQGDYEGAAEVFRSVTESEPDNVTAYVSLGTAYLRLNRLSEAVRAFRKAIDLDDRDANAHLGLGQTYQLSGDHASAIDELTTALRLAPSNPVASYSLALVYEATGDTDLEIEMLERTIASDPKYSLAEAKLGEVYLANGMYEQAIAPLRAAAEGRVPIAHIHARLAEAYYRSGNLESAENQLRLEIAENPKSPSPRAVLAQILIEQRRFGEARNELGTAISLTGDEALRARLEDELQRIEGK